MLSAPVGAIADIAALLRPLITELLERAQPIGGLLLHVDLSWFQQVCEVYVVEYCRFFTNTFAKYASLKICGQYLCKNKSCIVITTYKKRIQNSDISNSDLVLYKK